jgi:putative transposase
MARLPRLVVPGQAHLVLLRGHSGGAVFADDDDRAAFLDALRAATVPAAVAVHAYALLDAEVRLVVTPSTTTALSRAVQALGRRYVSAYNARHARSGTLWDGRFRCAVVEPGAALLAALRFVDGAVGATSAHHRSGGRRDPLIVDPPEIWRLGNTPFEREAAYRGLLESGLTPAEADAMRRAALGGWAIGSKGWVDRLAASTARPVRPRRPGRPTVRA